MSAYDGSILTLGNIVAYWPCDDFFESTTLHDLAYDLGLGVVGPIDFGVDTYGILGQPSILPADTSNCVYHHGAGSFQKILTGAAQAAMKLTGPFTYIIWVQPDSFVSNLQYIFGQWAGTTLYFSFESADINIGSVGTSGSGHAGAAGNPVMIAGTYDRHNAYVYVNGVQQPGVASTSAASTVNNNLEIGGILGSADTLTGYFQKIAVFSQALTASQIQSLYTNGIVTSAETSYQMFNVMPFSRQVNTQLTTSRQFIRFQNDSDTPMYMTLSFAPGLGGRAASPFNGVRIAPNGGSWQSSSYKGYFQICHSNWLGAKTLLVEEY